MKARLLIFSSILVAVRMGAVTVTLNVYNPDYPTCGSNTVVYDTVCLSAIMTVGSDPTPGDYFYGLYTPSGYRIGQEADFRVNNNGTSGWVAGDPGFGCYYGGSGTTTLTVRCDGAPAGAQHSELNGVAD